MAKRVFPSKRAPAYADVPDDQWNSWRWQLSHRLNSVEDLERILPLSESERKALSTPGLFRVDITPYFVSLIDPDDPADPVRQQVLPTDCRDGPVHRHDGGLAVRGRSIRRSPAWCTAIRTAC